LEGHDDKEKAMSSSGDSPSISGSDGGALVPTTNDGAGVGTASNSAGLFGNYSETSEFVLWEKYETVAMHFNDLIIRLRTQAVGGLAGVVAVAGIAVNYAQKPDTRAPWMILCGTLVILLFAWASLWLLDTRYYARLLRGAVNALLAHEQKTAGRINLSTTISENTPRYELTIHGFYLIVAVGLSIATIYAAEEAFLFESKQAKPVEYKIELSSPNGIKVNTDSTKIEHDVRLRIPSTVKFTAEPPKVP
jgi:hypothetical protein